MSHSTYFGVSGLPAGHQLHKSRDVRNEPQPLNPNKLKKLKKEVRKRFWGVGQEYRKSCIFDLFLTYFVGTPPPSKPTFDLFLNYFNFWGVLGAVARGGHQLHKSKGEYLEISWLFSDSLHETKEFLGWRHYSPCGTQTIFHKLFRDY